MTPTSRLKWCTATIRFWSVTDRVPNGLHLGHAGRIWNFALSLDGRQIASVHSDTTVRVWNIGSNNEYTKLPLDNPVDFCFAPNGQTVMTLEANQSWFIATWDAHSGSLLSRKPIDVAKPYARFWSAFSPDGTKLAYVGADNSVTVWNTSNCRQEALIDEARGKAAYVSFSPDSRYLLIPDMSLKTSLWDFARRRFIPLPWDKVSSAHFAASNEVVMVQDGRLVWWNPSTGHSRTVPFSQTARSTRVAFSPDGRFFVSLLGLMGVAACISVVLNPYFASESDSGNTLLGITTVVASTAAVAATRTAESINRRRTDREPLTARLKATIVLESVAVAALIVGLADLSFLLAYGLLAGGMPLYSFPPAARHLYLVPAGVIAGGFAALAVCYLSRRAFWRSVPSRARIIRRLVPFAVVALLLGANLALLRIEYRLEQAAKHDVLASLDGVSQA